MPIGAQDIQEFNFIFDNKNALATAQLQKQFNVTLRKVCCLSDLHSSVFYVLYPRLDIDECIHMVNNASKYVCIFNHIFRIANALPHKQKLTILQP